jgi:hypothetical protein
VLLKLLSPSTMLCGLRENSVIIFQDHDYGWDNYWNNYDT